MSIDGELAAKLKGWLESALPLIDEENTTEEKRYDRLSKLCGVADGVLRPEAPGAASSGVRLFQQLLSRSAAHPPCAPRPARAERRARRQAIRLWEPVPAQVSRVHGEGSLPILATPRNLRRETRKHSRRTRTSSTTGYQLNAASVRLTEEIVSVWNPNPDRGRRASFKINADGQYLKVVVEDELGVEIELDQRSEGFQWLVSFFVVFFAEAADKHENAILLLDEPGLHLHGLKQTGLSRDDLPPRCEESDALHDAFALPRRPGRVGHCSSRGHDGSEGRRPRFTATCRREIRQRCSRSRKPSATTWRRASSRRRETSCWKG